MLRSLRITVLLSASIFSLLSLLLYSCQSNSEDSFGYEINNDNSSNVADSSFVVLKHYYNSNPDTAVIMALELEKKYIDDNNSRGLLRVYSFLSELYQYRKNDPNLTLAYLTKALNIISMNPDLQFDPIYLYVNVGNVMFSYGLFNEAIYIYRQIPKIYSLEDKSKIMGLINSNIGLSFEELGQTDSARYYFDKSLISINRAIQGRTILLIQYNNYVSSIFSQNGVFDSLPYYYNNSVALFNSIDKNLLNNLNDKTDQNKINIQIDYHKNKMMSLYEMSKYYIAKKDFSEAISMLDEAVISSRKANSLMWTGDLFLSLSDTYILDGKNETAEIYLDSAIMIFKDFSAYDNLETAFRKKSDIFYQANDKKASKILLGIAEEYHDTLKNLQSSDELMLMKIQLAAKPVQLAMKNIEMSRNEKILTIKKQTFLIKLLVAALFLIIIISVVYYRLYRNLKNTRFQLAHRTMEQFNDENATGGNNSHARDSIEQELLLKFEYEVIEKKIYLESSLNLVVVAEKLDSNRSYISKLINTVYKMNYNDYINKLRIDEACRIICSNTDSNFTIDHLYSKVGFVGKTTFYTAFKKYTGVTPAVFFKINNQART
ncbi:MAG: helix-turn-helix domain-containing protein [Bacteroidales bacterium]|nr:helix-turn-helix domain-containing protein [Bacteroidales bacterium]